MATESTTKPTGVPERRPYLKRGVHRRTRGYVLLGVATIVWLALGMPTAGVELRAIPAPSWVVTALTTVFSILVIAVDSLPGPHGKAVLVFWRRRDPLPGSRAFEMASLDRDTRIDRDRLREAVGGKFPRAAKEQNAAWYRLYKSHEMDAVIQAMHSDYLLFRDLAWLSIVLVVLTSVNLVLWPPTARLLGIGAAGFSALYFVFRRAAAERGERFMSQVLVTASVEPKRSQA